jgi:hypothetical protein
LAFFSASLTWASSRICSSCEAGLLLGAGAELGLLQAQTLLAIAGLLLGGEAGEALGLLLGEALGLFTGLALGLFAGAASRLLFGSLVRLDVGHAVGLEVFERAEGDQG